MKAFVVTSWGAEGLVPAEVTAPTAGPLDVLVEVRAASINPLDRLLRDGELKALLPYRRPFVLGHDVAGVVLAVGADVHDVRVGDEVFARLGDLRIGAFAEQVAIARSDLAPKSATLSFAEAAAVPLVSLASWQLLVELADVGPGTEVLVHAGAGGLGSTLVQLAAHLGARVTTTARASDADRLRALGADVVIDHTTQDFAQGGARFDLVVDAVGGPVLEKSLTVLRPGGLAVSVVGPPDPAVARQLGRSFLAPVLALLSLRIRRRARRLGVRYRFFFMHADGARLAALAELYDDGTLVPVLDRTFAFDETLEAMSYVERGRARGKVVITH